MMRLRQWHARKGQRLHLDRTLPFCAVDPGKAGAGVVVGKSTMPAGSGRIRPIAIVAFAGTANLDELAAACLEHEAGTLVVEDQFAGRDMRALVRLARHAAILVGATAMLFDRAGKHLDVVWVPAQTWQWPVLSVRGGGRHQSGDFKAAAQRVASVELGTRFQNARKASQEGIADAWGIAKWWLHHAG